MPDQPDNTQAPTPGQVLAGTPAAPSAQPVAPQPQQPTPQQVAQVADVARHHAIGKAAAFLFGQERDPNTGEPVKQAPGSVFKSLLAGALLGSAIGSEGRAGGGSVGGFLSGFSRGGAGVMAQEYQRQQDAFARQRQTQQMSLEQQRFEEERTQHRAQLEQWNLENLARGREADYRDRDQLLKENEQDANVQKWTIDNGGYLASIPNNAVPGNGPELMQAMIKDPARFQAPPGVGRLLVKNYDFNGLNHDSKGGWTEKDGSPVDWSKHLTWSVYWLPNTSSENKPISMTASEWTRLYGVRFPSGTDPSAVFNVKAVAPLMAVATQNRRQERTDANETFKQKHDALNATINSARTNVTQLESEKRELLRQGYTEDDDEVSEIEDKIEAEQKREQDAISDMHPRIRERVTQKPTTTTQPTNKPAPSQPKPTFSPSKWRAANPNGDVNAAIAEAKRQGYQVTQ